ncbi:alkylated DNA repair protein alkB homolog 8 isoform X3 [Phyllopteryx taeniolatus]|uniref:alkylated DNA repair protein alkB homolog 8 isoform X3 n=1 Tax=Phyllopteryx taeniolatus TaxID=161469 RepID=UPI002AD41060|nr:alkylated DNA repair protein alkB homolog 8 isoform X3 [Phyllopteryx taeniolatus]
MCKWAQEHFRKPMSVNTVRRYSSLVVANGGLGNGVSREELSAVLKEMGEVETILMPPHKPYAFVTYGSEENARKAHIHLNGQKLQCGEENGVTLYLSFVDSVPCEQQACVTWPAGLVLVEDFVSPEEEALLLAAIDWSSTNDDVTAQKALKHRRVKHFGFEFCYDSNNVDKDKPLTVGLPEECQPVLERCMENRHTKYMPDQLTVNQYASGQGIPPHVDTHSAFEDTILSLSLGAKTVMEFRHPDGRVVNVFLPGRSLLVMQGESRYLWTHGITPRKFDMVPACDSQPQTPTCDLGDLNHLTLNKRGTRTSFTFRKIRREPCSCAFPSACDSQGSPSPPSPPSLPQGHCDAARLEEEYVHQVYDAIAPHFSSTRHSPWPRVCHFLSSLLPGNVLADVGCGNGKYLGVNPEVISVGCDRSSALVQICADRGFQAFVSDALCVPLRTATCDACISIAVIHHFSTPERRLAAVKELVRLLKPGGHALIYVWAFEQEYKQQKSKYLKDHNTRNDTSKDTPDPDGKSGARASSNPEDNKNSLADHYKVTDDKLSVHVNRTAFHSQDLLVPWHLKEGKGGKRREGDLGVARTDIAKTKCKKISTDSCPVGPVSSIRSNNNADSHHESEKQSGPAPVFHRYYHVFQQGELEQLCVQVEGVNVQSSYHDQGNWCVILKKNSQS